MSESTMDVVEIIIGILFCVMIFTAISSLVNRRKIVKKLRDHNEKVYSEYFSKTGILNNDINTAMKKTKFFLSKSKWTEITNTNTLGLLNLNRKLELTYLTSFILVFVIYSTTVAMMVYIKYG